MSWWEWLVAPEEKAFERVFDALIEARNAVRKAFQESERAKGQLAQFYAAFISLESSQERSRYRRQYQDAKSELDANEKRLHALSTDLAVIQDAASAARAGTRPFEIINDQVVVAGINTHGLEPGDIEAGKRRLAGVGIGWAGVIPLIVKVFAVAAAAFTAIAIAENWSREAFAFKAKIVDTQKSMNVVPNYPGERQGIVSELGASARVGVVTLGVVGLVGWLLAKRV